MRTSAKTIAGLAAIVLASQAMPAQAINKEWSAVAGFVGGVLVANAANCHRGYNRVVYQQQPTVIYQPVQTVVVEQPMPQGYYRWETERIWVPGCWVYEDRGCGTTYKIWQPGYYKTVKHKVWVDSRASCGW